MMRAQLSMGSEAGRQPAAPSLPTLTVLESPGLIQGESSKDKQVGFEGQD